MPYREEIKELQKRIDELEDKVELMWDFAGWLAGDDVDSAWQEFLEEIGEEE